MDLPQWAANCLLTLKIARRQNNTGPSLEFNHFNAIFVIVKIDMGRIHGMHIEEKNQVKTTEVEFVVWTLEKGLRRRLNNPQPQMNGIQMQINPFDVYQEVYIDSVTVNF